MMTRSEVLAAARDIVRWTLTLKRGIVTRGPSLLLFYGSRHALLRTPVEAEAMRLLFRKSLHGGFMHARILVARRPSRWPSFAAGTLRSVLERAAELREKQRVALCG